MVTIRLSLAAVALLTAALTTVVTVAPQPASAGTVACTDLSEPTRA